MLTLSFIDLDRDEYGNPNVRFLVKRGAFADGKIVRFNNGKAYIKREGEENFILEDSYWDLVDKNFKLKKLWQMRTMGFMVILLCLLLLAS